MINTAGKHASKVISQHAFAEVIENSITHQKSLHSRNHFRKNEIISDFTAGEVFSTPNYLTVQTGVDQHITLVPEFLQYSNHSCNPNIFFDTTTMQVIALRDIEPNDELCFFYPSTEFEMAQPFVCFCGSRDCLQNIKGAKYIPAEVLGRYRLTGFIQQQLKTPL